MTCVIWRSARVAGIDGVTLDVEPLEGAARDYREMRKKSPEPATDDNPPAMSETTE